MSDRGPYGAYGPGRYDGQRTGRFGHVRPLAERMERPSAAPPNRISFQMRAQRPRRLPDVHPPPQQLHELPLIQNDVDRRFRPQNMASELPPPTAPASYLQQPCAPVATSNPSPRRPNSFLRVHEQSPFPHRFQQRHPQYQYPYSHQQLQQRQRPLHKPFTPVQRPLPRQQDQQESSGFQRDEPYRKRQRAEVDNHGGFYNAYDPYFDQRNVSARERFHDAPGNMSRSNHKHQFAFQPNTVTTAAIADCAATPDKQHYDTSRRYPHELRRANGTDNVSATDSNHGRISFTLKKPHAPATGKTDRRPVVDPSLISKLRRKQTVTLTSSKPFFPYEKIKQVGEGTYGKVFKAQNKANGSIVALKRIKIEGEKDGFPITAVREIRLLQSLRHPNIVSLLEMMVQENAIYMIFEYMDHDLTGILGNGRISFKEENIKYFLLKLFEGLDFLHSNGVLHRDIKGSNILINSEGELKLADFGLARFMDDRKREADYTNRVITLWYRPPELLFGATIYGPEIDIWSSGCLAIELYTRKPLFPGQNEIHQLELILNSLGLNKEARQSLETLPWFYMVNIKVSDDSPTIDKTYDGRMSLDALKFIKDLIQVNPRARLTARQAINHEYMTKISPLPKRAAAFRDIHGEWHEYESKRRQKQ